MYNKRRRRPRPKINRYHPRIKKFHNLRIRNEARRKQPIQLLRIKDRHRPDRDPDPFDFKLNPINLYPSYSFEEWPLHPGIRYDQLRYGFTIEDIQACIYNDINDNEILEEQEMLETNTETNSETNAETNIKTKPVLNDMQFIQRALSFHNANGKEIRKQLKTNEIERWSFHRYDTGNIEITIAIYTLKLRSLKNRMEKTTADKQAFHRYAQLYHKRKRLMWQLRDSDFGRYKKIITYLGLKDKFEVSIVRGQGVHRYAHVYSKKKPPGGRSGHLSF